MTVIAARVLRAAWAYLRSPQATRLEIALAVGLFEAIRLAVGNP